GATHPTDQEPAVRITEPASPTAIAGQACIVVPLRAASRVAINNFQSDSLISMTLGINVSPDIGRLNIDTLGRRTILNNETTPQRARHVNQLRRDPTVRTAIWSGSMRK